MKRAVRHFIYNPLSFLGILFIIILVVTGVLAPLLAPYDPIEISPDRRLSPPSEANWMGTDEVGRDILSRIIHGARISLQIGVTIVFFAAAIGLVIGLVSGYFGGVLDQTLMRFTDMFMSFPTLILAIAMTAALGPSLFNSVLAMVIVWWPIYARLIRGEVLAVKERIHPRSSPGARPLRSSSSTFPTHDVVVIRAIDFGNAVMFCAALSFIGQPSLPAGMGRWLPPGDCLRDACGCDFPGRPFLTVMGFNLLGIVCGIFDLKLRGER
jgi:peptide/nickel transport system permease protein